MGAVSGGTSPTAMFGLLVPPIESEFEELNFAECSDSR